VFFNLLHWVNAQREAQKLAMKTGATSDPATSATKDATTAELDEAIEAKRSSGEEE